jgi:hypothetical protein
MKTGKTLEDGWKRNYQKQNYGLKIYLENIAAVVRSGFRKEGLN